MAAQSITHGPGLAVDAPALARWRAYHVFYHADRTRLLHCLVNPLFAELAAHGLIDRFYFVRYDLGGPHIRLRWRLRDEGEVLVAEDVLAKRAADFFQCHTSARPRSSETILAANRSLASADPSAVPELELVYPDNSWKRFPTMFELDRYGGIQHFADTLDLFWLSSLSVFDALPEHGDAGRAWANSAMLQLMLQLALGLAADGEEFIPLTGYGVHAWGSRLTSCIREADLAFEKTGPQLAKVALGQLEAATADSDLPGLVQAAVRLRNRISSLSAASRWRIAFGHIHMTANRLGLLNPEEAYLSRMVWHAVQEVKRQFPENWRNLWDRRLACATRLERQSLDGIIDGPLPSSVSFLTNPPRVAGPE